MASELELPDPTLERFTERVGNVTEFMVAWKKQPITLGTGLLTSSRADSPPSLPNAFRGRGGEPQAVFNKDTTADFHEISTSTIASSFEHMAVMLGVHVDVCGGILGASVQGSYDKEVAKNSDEEKVSLHSTYRFGTITFAHLPQLTYEAYDSVPSRSDRARGIDAFTPRYGDFYVGGLILGADNAVMVSSFESHENTKEHMSIKVTVKILFAEFSKTFTKSEETKVDTTSMSLTAYDSLAGIIVKPPEKPTLPKLDPMNARSVIAALRVWAAEQSTNRFDLNKFMELVFMGRNVEERAWSEFDQFGLKDGDLVTDEICAELCRRGLVVGLLLVPFSKCVDYVAAKHRP